MKITNKMVVESVGSLNELSGLKLPVKTAFKLAKVIRKMNEALETYQEVLTKLQQDHVEKDENGNSKTLDDPNDPNIKRLIFTDPGAFNKSYQELLEIETDFEIEKLNLDELGAIEIKRTTLYQIDWLLGA